MPRRKVGMMPDGSVTKITCRRLTLTSWLLAFCATLQAASRKKGGAKKNECVTYEHSFLNFTSMGAYDITGCLKAIAGAHPVL
jgi:hypothetical protein